jgi:hypothetical protein
MGWAPKSISRLGPAVGFRRVGGADRVGIGLGGGWIEVGWGGIGFVHGTDSGVSWRSMF